jgi:hypothetical protein
MRPEQAFSVNNGRFFFRDWRVGGLLKRGGREIGDMRTYEHFMTSDETGETEQLRIDPDGWFKILDQKYRIANVQGISE